MNKGRAGKRAPDRHVSRLPDAEPFWHVLLNKEAWGLVMIAVGVITFTALVSRQQGRLSASWSLALRQIFGVGAIPIALLISASGIVLVLWNALYKRFTPRWKTIVGCELAFLALLGFIHVAADGDALALAREGKAGGHIGWAFSQLLEPLLGKVISAILLALLGLMGIGLATGISWRLALWRIHWALAYLGVKLRSLVIERPPEAVLVMTPRQAPVAPVRHAPVLARGQRSGGKPLRTAAPVPPRAASSPRPAPVPTQPAKPAPQLPSLDLLTPDQPTTTDDADARFRAQIIEETLDAFGIPARVADWHRGPTVTQFDVEPGYVERQDRDGESRRFKIRVSKILALTNDLALALAAAPIRIEAPVPGRAVVGIEVPNSTKSLVGLRGVLESATFQKMRATLRIALGRDVSGEAVVADLAVMPHLLLAGTTGSGKSVCLNAIIASLLYYNTPQQLKLLMVDPKRVEFSKYNGVPHLIAPVVVDIEKVIVALRWVTREMDRRYAEFSRLVARNLDAYNRIARAKGLEPMSKIVVVIDELADLMLAAPDDVERTICRLAQMARATGIHLIIATQRPSVDVVTGLIKANFPARISFAVTSQVDSRVVLDVPGAEKLLGRGDMLFMAPDSPKLQRIQGCWVSDKELDALVGFWQAAVLAAASSGVSGQHKHLDESAAPWEDASLQDEERSDSLLKRAAELVRQHHQASTSFLQRQMRIGYPRAARLMDQLEKIGVVGPAEAAGRSRTVIGESMPGSDGVALPEQKPEGPS